MSRPRTLLSQEPIYIGELSTASLWRRQPFRLFFPLGWLLAWAGVLHWLLHALGWLRDYRPIFHSITQIQGFMICFAIGFLFTALPRRTGTAPAATWEMAVTLAVPPSTVLAAWFGKFDLAQMLWVVLVLVLVRFALRRLRGSRVERRPPNSFLWIPLAFLSGLGGSLLISLSGYLGDEYYELYQLGRLYLLQGLFVGLVLGLGGMVLPLLSHGASSTDAGATARDRLERAGHLAAALLFYGSFLVQTQLSLRGGYALRALITLVALLAISRIGRPPSLPGWQRWGVWLGAWMIPLGYGVAALYPAQQKAGLHVVFIGGFALMALSVGLHVTLAHCGYEGLVRRRFWPVALFAALMLVAMVLRGLVDFNPQRFFPWIGWAAGAFLLSTAIWAVIVLPRVWRVDAPPSGDP